QHRSHGSVPSSSPPASDTNTSCNDGGDESKRVSLIPRSKHAASTTCGSAPRASVTSQWFEPSDGGVSDATPLTSRKKLKSPAASILTVRGTAARASSSVPSNAFLPLRKITKRSHSRSAWLIV